MNNKFKFQLPYHIEQAFRNKRLRKPNGEIIKTHREARNYYLQQQQYNYEPQSEYEG